VTQPVSVDIGGQRLSLPAVMGVLNVTPDSFSDGGNYLQVASALDHAQTLIDEGADILDVGGESTRPGAEPVSVQQQLDRVIPVIESVAQRSDVIISVDTSTPEVMSAAVQAGAQLINDVRALQAPGALGVAAASGASVCLMHMQNTPGTMQNAPVYDDVVKDVMTFLEARVAACQAAGIDHQRLLIDPGFGFGKTLRHNVRLLAELERFQSLALPVLVGLSRKSMLGTLLDQPVQQRLYGSLAAALIAVERGAGIVRVHDVKAMVEVLRIWSAVEFDGGIAESRVARSP